VKRQEKLVLEEFPLDPLAVVFDRHFHASVALPRPDRYRTIRRDCFLSVQQQVLEHSRQFLRVHHRRRRVGQVETQSSAQFDLEIIGASRIK